MVLSKNSLSPDNSRNVFWMSAVTDPPCFVLVLFQDCTLLLLLSSDNKENSSQCSAVNHNK